MCKQNLTRNAIAVQMHCANQRRRKTSLNEWKEDDQEKRISYGMLQIRSNNSFCFTMAIKSKKKRLCVLSKKKEGKLSVKRT